MKRGSMIEKYRWESTLESSLALPLTQPLAAAMYSLYRPSWTPPEGSGKKLCEQTVPGGRVRGKGQRGKNILRASWDGSSPGPDFCPLQFSSQLRDTTYTISFVITLSPLMAVFRMLREQIFQNELPQIDKKTCHFLGQHGYCENLTYKMLVNETQSNKEKFQITLILPGVPSLCQKQQEQKTSAEWEHVEKEHRKSNVAMNWRYLTLPSSSRGILSSSNSNSSLVISTPNLKRIAVSISHPPSSHLGHPYPQYPKHMAAITALLLLQSSRSRAPREYQRLIGGLIASAFSKKEILPQNPCIGGAQK